MNGARFERPRVTFLSRLLGVLLVLSGLTRLWLSIVFGPDILQRLMGPLENAPIIHLGVVTLIIWSVGLALATVVVQPAWKILPLSAISRLRPCRPLKGTNSLPPGPTISIYSCPVRT